jgi:hypothetical protein
MLDSFVIYSQEHDARPKITALFGANPPATEPDAAPPTELLVLLDLDHNNIDVALQKIAVQFIDLSSTTSIYYFIFYAADSFRVWINNGFNSFWIWIPQHLY